VFAPPTNERQQIQTHPKRDRTPPSLV